MSTKQKQAERFLKDCEDRVAIDALALPRPERIRFAEIADALIEHYQVMGARQLRDVQVKLEPVRTCFDNQRLVVIDRRTDWDAPPRFQTQRREEFGPIVGRGDRGHEAQRTQDPQRLRSLQHHARRRPSRSRPEFSRAQFGHNSLALGRHGSRKCAKLNPAPA